MGSSIVISGCSTHNRSQGYIYVTLTIHTDHVLLLEPDAKTRFEQVLNDTVLRGGAVFTPQYKWVSATQRPGDESLGWRVSDLHVYLGKTELAAGQAGNTGCRMDDEWTIMEAAEGHDGIANLQANILLHEIGWHVLAGHGDISNDAAAALHKMDLKRPAVVRPDWQADVGHFDDGAARDIARGLRLKLKEAP